MKITYNWLKEYVDFAWDWPELVERLTMAGLEFEGVADSRRTLRGRCHRSRQHLLPTRKRPTA